MLRGRVVSKGVRSRLGGRVGLAVRGGGIGVEDGPLLAGRVQDGRRILHVVGVARALARQHTAIGVDHAGVRSCDWVWRRPLMGGGRLHGDDYLRRRVGSRLVQIGQDEVRWGCGAGVCAVWSCGGGGGGRQRDSEAVGLGRKDSTYVRVCR